MLKKHEFSEENTSASRQIKLTLKIRSFLAIQIVQHIRLMASMKNWELS
jgi:hypothetical protein